MDIRCLLCDESVTVRAIGAMVVTGNATAPDGDVLCRRCAALAPEQRRQRRDEAMARLLRAAPTERHGPA